MVFLQPSFAFALLPHLFSMVYNEGHGMSQFCVDVNYLLTNFSEGLVANGKFLLLSLKKSRKNSNEGFHSIQNFEWFLYMYWNKILDYPLVVAIVACIRQARVNLASEQNFWKLPFDLSKLAKACLEINMEIDADYFLHCYLDR